MTEQQAISKVVETATSQVGYREGDNNWNKYAAELDPLKVTYGNKQNMAWCGEFVIWVFYKCFGIDKALEMLCSPKPTGIPLCATAAGYFMSSNRFVKTPNKGDVAFFNVGGSINHTGIVISANGALITTVEGNSSDMVSRRARTYCVGDSAIAGFGRPKWSAVVSDLSGKPTTSTEIPVATAVTGIPTLRKGDKGETVRAAQFLLIGRGFTCGSYGADGDFGNATYTALCNFQRTHNLDADGIAGELTWAALLGVS